MRHTAIVSVVALAACGDAPQSHTDTDTHVDTMPDASEVIDDGQLANTFLAATIADWTVPITLCSAWRAGATLDAELAHKVKITLAPTARQGLTRAALDVATLGDIAFAASPFSTDHHAPSATSTVSSWQLLRYESHDTLVATVAHTLGALGVLEERYHVARDGSADPVVDVSSSAEVTFWWQPTGQVDAHRLGPCTPPDDWEHAVESMVIERGATHTTLVRFYRTPSDGTSMYLDATTIYPGSPDTWPTTAKGFWAHTYVARPGRDNDRTVIDFARDLGGWQTLFGPLARGEAPRFESISKIEYLDVRNKSGDVALTHIGPAATPNRTTWKVTAGPQRIDATELQRAFAQTCTTPTVGAVGYGDPLVMLVFCPAPNAPEGKELVAVVPVVWHPAPQKVGERITAIQPLSGRRGWTVAIGAADLTVEPQTGGAYRVDVTVQGQNVASMWTELGPLVAGFDMEAPIHARSADQAVELWIDRDWIAQGVGHSAIYASPRIALRWGERHDVVTAWDAIFYENTHHNWYDAASATTLDGVTLHWKVSFDIMGDTGLSHEVWVTGPDGEALLPKTAVQELDAR